MTYRTREEILWDWVKRVIFTILSLFIGVLIALYIQRDSLLNGCKRNSYRTALIAYGQRDISTARLARGEPFAAGKSRAIEESLLNTIPAPEGMAGSGSLAEVRLESIGGSQFKATVTEDALALQDEGCELAYPPLIEFIK